MVKKKKLNLIEELTTYKCDYQNWPLQITQPEKEFKEEAPSKPLPPWVRIDPQSHAVYKSSVHVPFDLYFGRKPIVNTDPRECFTIRETPKWFGTSNVKKPTSVLPPTLALSEVKNEEDLRRILKLTYVGWHKILMEEAAAKSSTKPKPSNRVVSEDGNLRFKSNLYPNLPPGWLSAACHWDCLQIRHLGDPFKTFWSRRGPEVQCSCCCNVLPDMLPKEEKEQIRQSLMENKISLPYDIPMTGYAGYRPICAKGVPIAR